MKSTFQKRVEVARVIAAVVQELAARSNETDVHAQVVVVPEAPRADTRVEVDLEAGTIRLVDLRTGRATYAAARVATHGFRRPDARGTITPLAEWASALLGEAGSVEGEETDGEARS